MCYMQSSSVTSCKLLTLCLKTKNTLQYEVILRTAASDGSLYDLRMAVVPSV